MSVAAKARNFSAVILLLLWLAALVAGQITQLPPPPVADPGVLADIFHAAERLQKQWQAIEYKERISFRLAGVVPEGKANRNLDFRQSADYDVIIKPGQPPERKFLQSDHTQRFGIAELSKQLDIPGLQETLPAVATLQTALLTFINSEYVNGYKEIGHEQIKNRRALKLDLHFRSTNVPIERCFLWIDEHTHTPLRAQLKIGAIGRFNNVSLLISYDDVGADELPASIHQEMDCDTFQRGIPLRLEHNATYSDFKPLTPDRLN
jgi:hypothetical protein